MVAVGLGASSIQKVVVKLEKKNFKGVNNMANDICKMFAIGRVTREIEIKHTKTGTTVGIFSLANHRVYTSNGEKKETVSFFDCVIWSKSAEILAQYAHKGSKLAITGYLQTRSWEDTEGKKRSKTEIVVEEFNFLDGNKQEWNPEPSQDKTVSQSQSNGSAHNYFSDADIPFVYNEA
jgi:single-strand DNA-binding protein